MRDPKEHLRDILEAMAQIEKYAIRGREVFREDELVQSWFVRHLQVLGEAARRLPAEVKAASPEIPWAQIVGMRNILVHDYFQIDTEEIWRVVENDLPHLKAEIQALLGRLEQK